MKQNMSFCKPNFLVFLIWGLSVGVWVQGGPTGEMFNCNRNGVTCTNGVCDAAGTTCTCNQGYTQTLGYHCVVNSVTRSSCTVADFCQNGGQCYKVNGQDTCFCPQMYYGTNCETPRIKVDCLKDGMTVTVTPHGSYQGKMYAAGKSGVAGCVLNVDGSAIPPFYTQTFQYAPNTCGLSMTENKDASNKVTEVVYTVSVVNQYQSSPNVLQATDQRITASCSMPSSSLILGGTLQSGVQQSHLNGASGSGKVNPITMKVVDGTTGTVEITSMTQYKLGDPLTIQIIMENTQTIPHDRVETCTASNRLTSEYPGYSSFDFVVNNGCPADNPIVRGNHISTSKQGITLIEIPIYGFAFPDGDIYLRCVVKLCSPDDVQQRNCQDPDPDTCTGTFKDGHGRKRRETPEGNTTTLSLSIKVAPPEPHSAPQN